MTAVTDESSVPKLEVVLITYNRHSYLKATLETLFADLSPIRSLPFTILDNHSTDGSTELIQLYVERFPTIRHIVHPRNIGGNANIVRAFEIATAKYLWVLCDDDAYDFTHWAEVEAAMARDADAIVVANYINPRESQAQLVGQMTFVPSTIYKTAHLTTTVMVNMAWNISTMFPQLAPVAHLINHGKHIEILDHWIVRMESTGDHASYVRGLNEDKHPLMASLFWQAGFLNALPLFHDGALKRAIIDTLHIDDHGPCFNTDRMVDTIKLFDIQDWNAATTWANLAFYPRKRCQFFIRYAQYFVSRVLLIWWKKIFKFN